MAHAINAGQGHVHGVTEWKAGVWAGLIAGLAFVMLEMGLIWMLKGESPWGPPHMMAAMVLGQDVLPKPGTWAPFDVKIMMVAMMIHLPLSIAYGLVGAWLCRSARAAGAAMIGAVLGIAIYIVNFYLIAPIAFPWFVMARDLIGGFSHMMFGVILGLAYAWLRKTRPGRIS